MQKKGLAYLSLFGGIVALSLSPMVIRWSEAPELTTSFYRMAIAALVLTPLGLHSARKAAQSANKAARSGDQTGQGAGTASQKFTWKALLPGLIGGAFTAADHSFWSVSLAVTSVANAMLFNYIAPLWVALFAALVWKEVLRPRFWVGLLAVLAGMGLVVAAGMNGTLRFNPGDLLAVLSSVFYAGYFLVAQQGRKKLPTLVFIWLVAVGGALGLFLSTRIMGVPLSGFPTSTWLIFLFAGLFNQVGGYFMVAYALGQLPAALVAPTMLASPVLSALLAIPFAGESLSWMQIVGGITVLCGITLVNRSRNGS